MRILCCLNRDIASNLALNLLLPVLAEHEAQVVLTEHVGSVSTNEPAQRRELRVAEQDLFNEIFFPLVERRAVVPTGVLLTFSEIQTLRKIPIHVVHNPNSRIDLQRIREYSPEVIVCIRYGAILRSPVLEIPRLGVLNLHSGLLPTYRGVLATFRALSKGGREIGCTLHYISDSTIDTGDIVSISRIPVVASHSLLRHVLDLYPSGTQMLADALRTLSAGHELPRRGQHWVGGNYYSYPTHAEWDAFCNCGWHVADRSDVESLMARYVENSGKLGGGLRSKRPGEGQWPSGARTLERDETQFTTPE